MSRWFRHYAGMMRDEKLVRVAMRAKQPVERVIWVWGAILESAAEINDEGRFEFDTAEAAYFLRTDEADLGSVVVALEALGRLCADRVVKWGDRQFQSDGAAERQKRYRERRKATGDDLRGESDVTRDVTPPSRDGAVTAQETENIEQIQKEANASSLPQKREIEKEFSDAFWPVYPRKRDKGHALKAYVSARKRADFPDIMAGVQRYAAERAGEDPQFTKYAEGWLNGDGWADEATKARPAHQSQGPPKARTMNDVLNEIQGKADVSHPGPTIDASFQRADRGGAANLVQLHAAATRFRP